MARINCVIPLLKVQLLGAFGIGRLMNECEPKAKRKLILVAAGIVLLAIFAISYAGAIGYALAISGAIDALPVLAVAISGIGCVFATFVKANGLLFGFKDFDAVVTMPVPLWSVVISRVAPLYGMGLAFSLLIGCPLMVIYLAFTEAGLTSIVFSILILLFAPTLPIALSIALSFLFTWIASRTPRAPQVLGIVGVVVIIAIISGIMIVAGGSESYQNDSFLFLTSIGSQIESSIGSVWPPASWALLAIKGSATALSLFIGISFASCAIVIALLSRFLIHLNSLLSSDRTRNHVRATTSKTRTPFITMVIKEFRLWISTPIYLMNTATGPALALIVAIAAVIAGPQILAYAVNIPGADHEMLANLMAGAFPWILTLFMVITPLSASATSLEGNARWIAQTAPVATSALIGSKIAINLLITVPVSLVAGIVAAFALTTDPLSAILMIAAPMAGSILASCLGAMFDTKRPNYNWSSAYEPVKRSTNVLICIGIGFVFVALGSAATLFAGVTASLIVAVAIIAIAIFAGRAATQTSLQER